MPTVSKVRRLAGEVVATGGSDAGTAVKLLRRSIVTPGGDMDDEWAVRVLGDWITKAERIGFGELLKVKRGPALDDLREREHPTRIVVASVLGHEKLPTLVTDVGSVDGSIYLDSGVELAKYALNMIRTKAELQEHAAPSAPNMAADALHSTVWQAAQKLWTDGHHAQAVQRAATLLNASVQTMTGRYDVSDVVLMQQVFSLSAPESGKPRLRWPGDDSDLTVKAMRTGILNFSQGCFSAIRNPVTHGSGVLDMQFALEQLATLSTLARWIDVCTLITAESAVR